MTKLILTEDFKNITFKNGTTITIEQWKELQDKFTNLKFKYVKKYVSTYGRSKETTKYSLQMISNTTSEDWFAYLWYEDEEYTQKACSIKTFLKHFFSSTNRILTLENGFTLNPADQNAPERKFLLKLYECKDSKGLSEWLSEEMNKKLTGLARSKNDAVNYLNTPPEVINWINAHYIAINAIVSPKENALAFFEQEYGGNYKKDSDGNPAEDSGVKFSDNENQWGNAFTITFNTANSDEIPDFIKQLINKNDGKLQYNFPRKGYSTLRNTAFIMALIDYFRFNFGYHTPEESSNDIEEEPDQETIKLEEKFDPEKHPDLYWETDDREHYEAVAELIDAYPDIKAKYGFDTDKWDHIDVECDISSMFDTISIEWGCKCYDPNYVDNGYWSDNEEDWEPDGPDDFEDDYEDDSEDDSEDYSEYDYEDDYKDHYDDNPYEPYKEDYVDFADYDDYVRWLNNGNKKTIVRRYGKVILRRPDWYHVIFEDPDTLEDFYDEVFPKKALIYQYATCYVSKEAVQKYFSDKKNVEKFIKYVYDMYRNYVQKVAELHCSEPSFLEEYDFRIIEEVDK